ncbi:hypothetical protein [Paraburkholderia acidipaludis]|uniref:hypothetical protein n=1 Tax=Paraburkholderia acidipaludis TaxID=660537 RepID=UPI0004848399|nr:hypothetical protein [Paraburkholderia acidipaludis]
MLSPHEFATLMLVRHSPDQIDMNRTELGTLLERRLVSFESRSGDDLRLSLTRAGRMLLEAVGRLDAAWPRASEVAALDRFAAGL